MNGAYIKRIIDLPDSFFSDWKWSEGDRYVAWEHNCHRFTFPEVTTGYCDSDSFPQWRCASCGGEYYVKWKPLPNLNQLMNMVDADWKCAYTEFIGWFYDCSRPFGVGYTCPEEMWIELVVYKKLQKLWDTTKGWSDC